MKRKAHWNGNAIIGWLLINGIETQVTADRDIIYRHAPGYSDAITWELSRFAEDIIEKLGPYFQSVGSRHTYDSSYSALQNS